MRTTFLSISSFVLVLFVSASVSAQSLDGQVERDPAGDTAIYEYDSGNRILERDDDSDGDSLDGKDNQLYDERDLKFEDTKGTDPGEDSGGSVDPINDPEFFPDNTGGTLPGEKGGSVDPINNPEAFKQLEECPDCQSIQDKIDKANQELKDLQKAKADLEKKQAETAKQLDDAKKEQDEAKQALEDFDNPKSYAESEGNRVDSSDIAAQRWAYANAWAAYQNGDMTAHELQDFWEDFDDADLQKAKEGYRKKLEKDIENAEKAVKDLEARKEQQEAQEAKVQSAMADLEKNLKKLQQELEDCLKKCGRSWIDSFFDIFIDLGESDAEKVLDETDEVLDKPPYEYDGLNRLQPLPEGDFQVDSFFDVFYEIDLPDDPKDLPPGTADTVVERLGGGGHQVDSFFDVFFDVEVSGDRTVQTEMVAMDLTGSAPLPIQIPKAPCPKCQSILDKINAKEKELAVLQTGKQALLAKSGKLDQAISKAEERVQNLKDALNRMENPSSWAESEGNRIDSADLEARRAAFADAWGRYQSGQMSAQQLEEYWNNFDEAERNKWKQKIKDKLKEKIKDAEKTVKDLKDQKAKAEAEIKDAEAKIQKCKTELEKLKKEYEDCIKKCKTPETDESWMDTLGNWWDNLVGPKPIDPEQYAKDLLEQLVSPPIVLPGPADDVAPTDEGENKTREVVFENLDIIIEPGETVEIIIDIPRESMNSADLDLRLNDNGNLVVSNIGSSGEDGVSLDLGDGTTVGGEIPDKPLPPVSINPDMLLPGPQLELNRNGQLTVSNIGSSGEDGVSIDLNELDLSQQILNPNPTGRDFLLTPDPQLIINEELPSPVLDGEEWFELTNPQQTGGGVLDLPIIGIDPDGGVVNPHGMTIIPGNEPGEFIIHFDNPPVIEPGGELTIPVPLPEPEHRIEIIEDIVPGDVGLAGLDYEVFVGYSLDSAPEEIYFNSEPLGFNVGSGVESTTEPETTSPPDNETPPQKDPEPVRDTGGADIIISDGWSEPNGIPALPQPGFDPIFDLQQSSLGGGTFEFDNGGRLIVSNIGSSGEDGVRQDLPPLGDEDGIDLLYFGTTDRTVGLLWPPSDLDPKSEPKTPETGTPDVDFFRPLILQFPDDLGRSTLSRPDDFTSDDPDDLGDGELLDDGTLIVTPPNDGNSHFIANPDGTFTFNPPTGSPLNLDGDNFDVGLDDGGRLTISNIGSSGEDGVRFDPPPIGGGMRFSADLSIKKTVNAQRVTAGSQLTYTITVSNGGPQSAALVEVTEHMPECLELVSTNPAQGSYSNGVWNVGRVPVGQSISLELVAKVKPDCSGDITNKAEITHSNLPDPDDLLNLFDEPDFFPDTPGDVGIFVDGFESGDTSAWSTGDPGGGGTTDGLPPGEPVVREPVIPPESFDPNGGGNVIGDPGEIFTDGFESGDTSAWGDTRNDPPPSPPSKCQVGFHNDRNCGGTCDASQRCIHSIDEEDCYVCGDQCSPNFASRENCNSGCDASVGRCVPAGENGNCWECLRVDPSLVSPCVGLGKHSTNRCDGACSDNQECVRAATDQECYECRAKPEPEPECHNDFDCDDGDFCNGAEICQEGRCVSGRAIDADDGDPCTEDFCNPEDGTISNTPIPGCGEPEPQCPANSFERSGCSRCDAGCEPVPNIDNLPCYQCKDAPVCIPECGGRVCGDDGCGGSCGTCASDEVCNSAGQCERETISCGTNFYETSGECTSCPAGCTSPSGSTSIDDCSCPTQPQCPSGTTADRAGCSEGCSNGVCLQTATAGDTECVQCFQCPPDMFTDQATCEAGNNQGCEVGGTSGSLQCWKPRASCEEACAAHDFSAIQQDFTAEVESILNSVSCVSSYQMQIQQARVGNCDCFPNIPPQITFDHTPPICKDTVCGDVPCNGEASCQTGPNETTTVRCNWGGWQKEALYQYRPILGGQ